MNLNEQVVDHWNQHGDRIKFKQLESSSYDMIRGDLTKYAYGRLKDWMDAEDAVQETYARILKYPPHEGMEFGAVFKITLDRAIAEIKSKNANQPQIEEDSIEDYDDEKVDREESNLLSPDQALNMVHLTDLIADLSETLPLKRKHIVRLSMIFNYSYREVCGITKTSEDYVRNTLHAFRKRLKEHPRYEDIRI